MLLHHVNELQQGIEVVSSVALSHSLLSRLSFDA